MKISTMRRIDCWVGLPGCWALTLLQRLRSLFPAPKETEPRRILFVKPAEQGATVLAASAMGRAVEMVGRENVFFLCFDENRFIVDLMKLIPAEQVLTIRTNGIVRCLLDVLRVIRQARRLKIDTTIDLEFFARSSALLGYLSGASRRVGLHAYRGDGPGRGDLLTHRVVFNPHIHTSQMFRLLVEAANVPAQAFPSFDRQPVATDDLLPSFEPDAIEVSEARRLLAELAGHEPFQPLVLLNPNCSDLLPIRAWPPERYVELARRLLETFDGLHIAMTGAPDEAEPVSRLVEQVDSDRCFNLAGHTQLRQLLAIYGLADVLVTNDSGPAHFATLTAIDVVTLFGPETPELFGSRTPQTHIVWESLACSPCVSAYNNRTSACTNNVCLQRIAVERVYEIVCRCIEQRTE